MSDDAQISSQRPRESDPSFCLRRICRGGFTIIELLVIIAIIAILVAMIIPALPHPDGSRSAGCMNRLHQIGVSLLMYSSDHNSFPSAIGSGPSFKTWADQLASYNPLNPLTWTNRDWHCPTYIEEGGKIIWRQLPSGAVSSSYAYNAVGMIGDANNSSANLIEKGSSSSLGLSGLKLTPPENRIPPSDTYGW
jgi:type II secretory pathway pseudopilin PulG